MLSRLLGSYQRSGFQSVRGGAVGEVGGVEQLGETKKKTFQGKYFLYLCHNCSS